MSYDVTVIHQKISWNIYISIVILDVQKIQHHMIWRAPKGGLTLSSANNFLCLPKDSHTTKATKWSVTKYDQNIDRKRKQEVSKYL